MSKCLQLRLVLRVGKVGLLGNVLRLKRKLMLDGARLLTVSPPLRPTPYKAIIESRFSLSSLLSICPKLSHWKGKA
jgi:hypothetical protein